MGRRTSALLLLVIYLFTTAGVRELCKLPVLAEHYYDHKSEGNHQGLLAFLTEHYINENGTDKDANEDNRLPFKSVELISINYMVIPPAVAVINLPELKEQIFIINYSSLFLPSSYPDAIWQPPRNCCTNFS